MKGRPKLKEQPSFSNPRASCFTPYSSLFTALASGILMGMTTLGAWPLAWIALAPLWVLVVKNEEGYLPLKIFKSKFLIGLVWGIGYHGVALFWITGIHPMTWMGVPWLASLAIALLCWSLITLWGAALVATWSASLSLVCLTYPLWTPSLGEGKMKQAIWNRVLIGVALWCSLERYWSLGPLWWSSLSYTQSPHNLAILHLGQISGPTAVTAAIVAVNSLIAEAWIEIQKVKNPPNFGISLLPRIWEQGRQERELFFLCLWPLAFGLILHLVGFGLYSRPLIQPPVAALKVGIIQGNIPNEIKLYAGGLRRAIEGYTDGYRTLASAGVDAVLTPEGALPFLWNEQTQRTSSFYSAVKEKGVVAWLGTFGEREQGYSNSLFTITGKGEIFSRYDKEKLVPFGEYIPFEQFLGGVIKRLSPLDEHQKAGAPNQLFDTPFGRAIVGICYDSAYSEHFRYQAASGGQFILSASNDAHYNQIMPAQHNAQDVMRAIETDRWAVRATNTGYSAIIDPHGRRQWISGIKTYETHAATIYRQQTQTLYVRWGDWLTSVLLICGAVMWLFHTCLKLRITNTIN